MQDVAISSPQVILREADFGSFDAETIVVPRSTPSRVYPRQTLHGQIRATFLAARVWKRWRQIVSLSRACKAVLASLRPILRRPLRLAFAMIHRSTVRRASARASARLLGMVLRPALMRARTGAFSKWHIEACKQSVRMHVESNCKKALKKLDAAHRKNLETEKGISSQVLAEAKLHGGLREQELQRRLHVETCLRRERLASVLLRIFTKRRIALLSQGFGEVLHRRQTADLANMRATLESESLERKALSLEIGNLTAADAEMSAELTRTAHYALQRSRYSTLLAATMQLRQCFCRRLRIGFSNVQKFARANPQNEITTKIMANNSSSSLPEHIIAMSSIISCITRRRLRVVWCRLAENNKETAPFDEGKKRDAVVEKSLLSDDSEQSTRGTDVHPKDALDSNMGAQKNSMGLTQLMCQKASKNLPLEMSESLTRRADAVLRLKVRLGVRKDFAARVWPVPLPKPFSSNPADIVIAGADADALSRRLARGGASLLEYILSSAVRSRQRAGLNALLAACRLRRKHGHRALWHDPRHQAHSLRER